MYSRSDKTYFFRRGNISSKVLCLLLIPILCRILCKLKRKKTVTMLNKYFLFVILIIKNNSNAETKCTSSVTILRCYDAVLHDNNKPLITFILEKENLSF